MNSYGDEGLAGATHVIAHSPGSDDGAAAVARFLERHPNVETIDVLFSDLSGILRGKRLPARKLPQLFERGVRLPGAACSLGINEEIDSGSGVSVQGGPDCLCKPVGGTLASVPWSARPAGQTLVSMWQENGQPYGLDPRQILAKVVRTLNEKGLHPVVALEVEFYLIERQAKDPSAPTPASTADRRSSFGPLYGINDLDSVQDYIAAVYEACRIQDIAAQAAMAETGPMQLEVTLDHCADALRACDQLTYLKRAVRGTAAAFGFDVTFMAKPYADQAGSGLHVHVSLLDENGQNKFAGSDFAPGQPLGHAIAGLIDSMPEAMAIFGPNMNSYRRVKGGDQAPSRANWGVNDRGAAIRVPSSDPANRRIEHRVAAADANPYLTVAAILAGVDHGLEEAAEPPSASSGDAGRAAKLPAHWVDALREFERSKLLRRHLGPAASKVYGALKRRELEAFNRQVTPLEYSWYLVQG